MERSGKAIAALVLGILSLLIGWVPFVGLVIITPAFIISILALIECSKPKGPEGKGMAIAGIIMSSVAFLLSILALIAFLIFLSAAQHIL